MRLPKNRPPEHPGEILREEFIKPLALTQEKLADALGISFRRVNEIVNGKRGVSAETALLLAGYFKTTAALWMNLQACYDLHAARKRLERSGHKLAATA